MNRLFQAPFTCFVVRLLAFAIFLVQPSDLSWGASDGADLGEIFHAARGDTYGRTGPATESAIKVHGAACDQNSAIPDFPDIHKVLPQERNTGPAPNPASGFSHLTRSCSKVHSPAVKFTTRAPPTIL